MVALRAPRQSVEDAPDSKWPLLPRPNPRDWLTLEQAACELGVSVSTVRRRIRRGELRNRIIPRRGGFAYRIYVPNSRHGREPLACPRTVPPAPDAPPLAPRDLEAYRRERAARLRRVHLPPARDERPASIDRLATAVARFLGSQRMPLSERVAPPAADARAPYARYRALVRKRRWWQI